MVGSPRINELTVAACRRGIAGLAWLALVVVMPLAADEAMAPPRGEVLLTVAGAIDRSNVDAGAAFDREMLDRLERREIRTSTPWTDGVAVFSGVLLSDLLDHVGISGTELVAHALNDYSAVIPVSDVVRYGVILADEANGVRLTRRDKGPLWVMYPLDSHAELGGSGTTSRLVWQLDRLEVR